MSIGLLVVVGLLGCWFFLSFRGSVGSRPVSVRVGEIRGPMKAVEIESMLAKEARERQKESTAKPAQRQERRELATRWKYCHHVQLLAKLGIKPPR